MEVQLLIECLTEGDMCGVVRDRVIVELNVPLTNEFKILLMIVQHQLFGCSPGLFCCDENWGAMRIGSTDIHDIAAVQSQVSRKNISC